VLVKDKEKKERNVQIKMKRKKKTKRFDSLGQDWGESSNRSEKAESIAEKEGERSTILQRLGRR